MSLKVGNTHPGAARNIPLKQNGYLRITRLTANIFKAIEETPFLSYLNKTEKEQVRIEILSKNERIEQYSNWIKEGNWDEVVKNGKCEAGVTFTLMGAHALKKIDTNEITIAMQFIDVAMELGNDWRLEKTNYPNVPSNLNIKMLSTRDEGFSIYKDIIIAIREVKPIPCIMAHKFNPLNFKIYPTYKMPNIQNAYNLFKNRLSNMSVKPLGKKIILHGYEGGAIFNIDHDNFHYDTRCATGKVSYKPHELFYEMVLHHSDPVMEYLKEFPPYQKRPQPKLGENDWVLPKDAPSIDRIHLSLEYVVLRMTEGFINFHDYKSPHELFKSELQGLTATEREECLKDLAPFFGPEWDKPLFEKK